MWAQLLLHLFWVVANTSERHQEDQIRLLAWSEIVDYAEGRDSARIGRRVLDLGFTTNELAYILAVNDDGLDERTLRMITSLALDVGNDLGVAVPSTVTEGPDQLVYRIYRTGENAVLSSASHSRLGWHEPDDVTTDRLDDVTRDGIVASTHSSGHDAIQAAVRKWHATVSHKVEESPVRGFVEQKWVGELTRVDRRRGTFRAQVTSDVHVGERDAAALPFKIVPASQHDSLNEGSIINWYVYDTPASTDEKPELANCAYVIGPKLTLHDLLSDD